MDSASRKLWAKIVGTGYFPEELPPCFTTIDLVDIVSKSTFSIDRFKLKGDAEAVPLSSKILPFSIPHVKGYRRQLGVPGPFHYIQLCHSLIKNRAEITAIHQRSELSIYEDHDPAYDDRYIAKPDFRLFIEERILRSLGYRYLLNVDVTRFYPSIYTHSIPWAIHTKTFAKSHSGHSYYGNELDTFASNCQDKQTMGLPIGPDSSRIISEIILSRVDEELQTEFFDFNGIRNVDDYYLFFKTHAAAEKGRTVLQNLLRYYELELNVTKERIVELPDILESEWKREIRSFKFRNDDGLQRTDLISFFDMSFSLARAFPNDIILPYAIAKLRSLKVARGNWKIFQAFLLNALTLESKVLVQVIHLLLATISSNPKRKLNEKSVKEAFESFLQFHSEHDNHYELLWALWFYYQVKYILPSDLVKKLNNSENDFVILMLLALENAELTEVKLNKRKWIKLVTTDNLFTEHWLLAYEGVAGEWLTAEESTIQANKFFNHLLSKKVQFFKPSEEDDEDLRLDAPDASLAKEMEAREEDNEDEETQADDDIF